MNDSFEFSDDESESVGKKLREQELRRCGSLDDSSSSSSFSSSSEDANDRLNAFEKSKLYEESSSESESSSCHLRALKFHRHHFPPKLAYLAPLVQIVQFYSSCARDAH